MQEDAYFLPLLSKLDIIIKFVILIDVKWNLVYLFITYVWDLYEETWVHHNYQFMAHFHHWPRPGYSLAYASVCLSVSLSILFVPMTYFHFTSPQLPTWVTILRQFNVYFMYVPSYCFVSMCLKYSQALPDWYLILFIFLKKQTLFLLTSFGFTAKFNAKYRDFPYSFCPRSMHPPPEWYIYYN